MSLTLILFVLVLLLIILVAAWGGNALDRRIQQRIQRQYKGAKGKLGTNHLQ